MNSGAPDPGIYLTGVRVCPHCKGSSASGIILAGDAKSGGCPVCGGLGRVMTLEPAIPFLLATLAQLGLIRLEERALEEGKEGVGFSDHFEVKEG